MTVRETDVAVIGAGPIGLFAVFALGQVGLSSLVIDALQEPGGQCAALYPDKPIYDVPSRKAITAGELVDELLKQAAAYRPSYCLGRRVDTLQESSDGFSLTLSDGTTVTTRGVIVAAGAGAFGPNRPPLPGIEQYEGQAVFYSLRSPERLRGQRIAIAGGGDSAADWAVILADIAAHVTLIHRRRIFRALPTTMAAIARLSERGRVAIAAPRVLHGLDGDGTRLNGVILRDEAGAIECIPASALLCFFGLSKDISKIVAWEIGAGDHGVPVDHATLRTQRPRVYAIGDIALYPGKLKLILTGFAEAAAAAHALRAELHPDRPFHFQYSTSLGLPGLAGTKEN